ncbi:PAS domain-containing protein [Caulobacter soli]|uniref:PAS domain-containing protein n=1 Tax=Caulobacter soli TaxID=2708539 RepID=UPI0013ECB3FC|nr:PAS domain-containing protein [Caulobacter soli]
MKIEDPHAKARGRASPDAISAWLIPEIPPPAWRAALVTVAAILGAVGLRVVLLGLSSGVGATLPFFPAMILVTLYAGWRWGVLPTLAGSAFAWWLWGGLRGEGLDDGEIATLVLFLLSAAFTTAVTAGLRGSVIGLADARRRQIAAEARLEVTQTSAGVGPWEWEVATNSLELSPTARKNLGVATEGPIDLEVLLEQVHPDDRALIRQRIREAVKTGPYYEVEYRLPNHPDGERWIHGRGQVVRDADGRALRILGVNFEVTQRRRAEESLRESEARFRALADSAPALMWISGEDGVRIFVNAAYVDFAGVSYADALVLDWRSRLHADDLGAILKAQIAGEASRKPFNLEGRYRRADGEMRWLKSFSQPRHGPGGEFIGFIGIAFDITETKDAEVKLTGLNELLADRVQEALSERDEAQAALTQSQKLEAIGQLTGGVAHDFNNLLTVIIGALDVLQRNPDDDKRRDRMLSAAQSAARRGEKLTQHLLAFARRQPLNPEICRIDAMIGDSEGLLRRAVGEGVELTLDLKAGGRTTLTDSSQFEAALLNLVVNARDATPPGGKIAVSSQGVDLTEAQGELPAGRYLRIAVTDTGEGMDAETVERAFEPFYTTKPVGKGTGLGLSQVYGFARQSGGRVTIDSKVGEGTTVAMLLPVREAFSPVEVLAVQPPATRATAHVLLVEDDVEVGDLIAAMIDELGHMVSRAASVDEALAITRADPTLGLVITDVIMPDGKSGVDLAVALAEERPELPVLLSSGYTGQELVRAHDTPWLLLRKPYALDALAQAMADAWDQHAATVRKVKKGARAKKG